MQSLGAVFVVAPVSAAHNVHSFQLMFVYIMAETDLLLFTFDGNIQLPKEKETRAMTYTKISLYTSNGIPEALSNLWYGSESSVTEITDAVEDAKEAKDLLRRLGRLKLLRKFQIDRETPTKVRLKSTDWLGNISYLEIRK